MNAMNFFDYVTLNLGWLINNTLWNIIATSGIVIIPFIIKVMAIFKKSREQGADEGNQGLLIVNWLEMYVYIAIVVIFSTCIPSMDPDFKILQYKQDSATTCSYNDVMISDSKYQAVYSQLGGQDIAVPIWWYAIHALSVGVTQAAVTALPCNTDLRQVQAEIQNLRINDPILLEEVQNFYGMCFNPSYNKMRQSSSRLSREEAIDVSWPGSYLFLNSPGYYDTFRAKTPQKGWQYDNNRDVGLNPGDGYTGYPVCKEWWSDSEDGLKVKLMAEVESQKDYLSLSEIWFNTYGWIFNDRDERDETLLRSLLNPEKFIGTSDNLFSSYSGDNDKTIVQKIGSGVATGGLVWSSMTKYVEMDAFRQAAPMLQSVLLMSVIILLPIIITLGAYEPKVVVTLTFVIFAIIFLTFVWELGRFLDSKMIEMVYDGSQQEDSISRFFYLNRGLADISIIRMITSTIFILFPVLLLGAMSWTGYHIGNGISNMMNKSGQTMQDAGGKGADLAGKGVKAAATKGMK